MLVGSSRPQIAQRQYEVFSIPSSSGERLWHDAFAVPAQLGPRCGVHSSDSSSWEMLTDSSPSGI